MTLGPRPMSPEEFRREALAIIVPPFVSKYGAIRWEDLDQPGPEVEWLVKHLLTVGDKSIIGGPSQSGKSFLAVHIGMAIATGREVFGKRVLPGLVIYQAGESGKGVKKRLRAYRKRFDIPAGEPVPFVLIPSRVDLYSPEGDTLGLIEEIQGICRQYDVPLRALFIDTLAKAQGMADENSGKDMAQVLANVDTLQEKLKCHVCLVHHLNADGTKLRGHTSIFANLDQVLGVTMDKETRVRTLATSKMKEEADDLEIKFELAKVPLGEDEEGEEISSCVCLPVGEKDLARSPDSKASDASPGERTFLAAFFKARDEHGQPRPPGLSMIPESAGLVVEWKDMRQVYLDLEFRDDANSKKEDNRIRQALHVNGKKLRNRGIIGAYKNLLWWTGRAVHGVPATYAPRKKKYEGNVIPLRPGQEVDNGNPDDELPF